MIICRLFVCSRAGIAPDNPLRIRGKTLILSYQPKIKCYMLSSFSKGRISQCIEAIKCPVHDQHVTIRWNGDNPEILNCCCEELRSIINSEIKRQIFNAVEDDVSDRIGRLLR